MLRVKSGFPVFFRLLRLTLFHSGGSHARLTPKRLFVMAGFIPLFFCVQVTHWIAFFLDDLFFRGYKDVEIKEPVFMLGIPRSGSTFLHRVLAKDTENFTTLNLWEMAFAPSIIERKFWMTLGAIDGALGGFGRKLFGVLDDRIFASVRKIHRVSMFEPEEDDLVLFPIVASAFLLFPFPFPDELWHLAYFDTQTPPEDRQRIMSFYKTCVQRHLYVHGTDRRFLSKNPAFSPKIDALNEFFPDSMAVCNVRNPYQAIPSLLSFLSFSWDRFGNDPKGNTFRDMILDMAGHWYRYPIERFPAWPESRHTFMEYGVLTGDPKQAVLDLYDRFGLEVGPAFAEVLDAEREKALRYRSKHAYSLDQFDLTSDKLLEDYGDIFEHYGFDKNYPAASESVDNGEIE